jgi:hypothetical protein
MKCVECGVIVYPIATCIMWAGPAGCRLRETITCKDCYATKSVPDPGRPPRYNNPEVGIHTALQYLANRSQEDLRRSISNFPQDDVSNQQESVVQEQVYTGRTTHNVGPKSAFVEQVRQDVP